MSEGLRQAALGMSALDPEDRVWLLGQLDDTERALLATVLARIEEGGAASSIDSRQLARDGMRPMTRFSDLSGSGHQSSGSSGQMEKEGAQPPASLKGIPPGDSVGGEAASTAMVYSEASAFARLQDQLALDQLRVSGGPDSAIAATVETSPMLRLVPASGAAPDGTRDSSSARQRVIYAQPREIFVVLSAEPDWMVAAVCGLHRWQWLPELFQLFGDDRAARIKALVRAQPEHGAGARDTLIELLGTRLLAGGLELRFDAGAEGVARGTPKRGRLGRVFGRLTNWLL